MSHCAIDSVADAPYTLTLGVGVGSTCHGEKCESAEKIDLLGCRFTWSTWAVEAPLESGAAVGLGLLRPLAVRRIDWTAGGATSS